MAAYKCKKCNTSNTVLQEWIELGISRVVTCKSCGHKMNLNLKARPAQNTSGTQVSKNVQGFNHFMENEPGTNVVGINKKTKSKFKFQIIKNSGVANNLLIKNPKENYTIFIGRNPESSSSSFNAEKDISWILEDHYLSRLHCSIKVQKQNNKLQFIIEDLNSTNGTTVNKTKLEPKDQILLHIGDEIEVGDTVFILAQD